MRNGPWETLASYRSFAGRTSACSTDWRHAESALSASSTPAGAKVGARRLAQAEPSRIVASRRAARRRTTAACLGLARRAGSVASELLPDLVGLLVLQGQRSLPVANGAGE